MLDSPIIDIAIGLSFLYFLLGLITSAVNEIIQARLKSRSRELKSAILNFLDRDWDEIGNKIIESPYVRTLQKDATKFPSYIPSSAFAQSIIDVIKGTDDLPDRVEDIRETIRKNPVIKGDARVWLLGLIDQSYGNVEVFYQKLEDAYNDGMDRVREWYGKKAKLAILLIGVVFSIALNIDTIHITQSLWKNKETAKTLSALVTSSMENIEKTDAGFQITDDDGNILYSVDQNAGANISKTVAKVNTLPIPLGWDKQTLAYFKQPGWGWELLSMIGGWAITSIAIFLGAPFWFDLLRKAVNLRGSSTNQTSSPIKK